MSTTAAGDNTALLASERKAFHNTLISQNILTVTIS